MKKSLFAMGMLAMAVASCTNEEVVDIPSSKGISFNNPYVGTSVRAAAATETTVEKLKEAEAGFYVYGGYETVPNVFENTHVTYKGDKWEYSPLSYWVAGETYRILGYAPDMGTTPTFLWEDTNAANATTLTFTDVTVNEGAQKDFVIGTSGDLSADTKPTVTLPMKHALSMVKVTLVSDFRDGVKLAISDFSINGINTQATFKYKNAAPATSDWSDHKTVAAFTDTEGITLASHGAKYENEYIVIPQLISNVTVTFKGTLTDENDQAVGSSNTKSFTINIPTDTYDTWNVNSRYNYTAVITGSNFGLDPITFGDPDIEDWGRYTDETVTIQ